MDAIQTKLKIARMEIEAIIKKHDLGSIIILHTPGMSEFFYDIRPSYSCAWIEGEVFRMKSKLEQYNGDKERREYEQTMTAQMFDAFAEQLNGAAGMFIPISQLVTNATRAEHTPGEFVPDTEH